MELLKHTAQIRAYCDYIDEHALNVKRAWDALQEPCKHLPFIYDDCRWHSIDELVREHDLSKVSPEEFIQYQQWFFPVDDKPKNPPVAAFQHHYDQNPHHWQNWASKEYYHPYEAEVHCVCMVIDWMAMSYKFGGSAEQYYRDNADKIHLPDWAVSFVLGIFKRLRDEPAPQGGESDE